MMFSLVSPTLCLHRLFDQHFSNMNTAEQTTTPLNQQSDLVRYEERDGIALIGLCSPPVNGLGDKVRHGIAECLTRGADSAAVHAVVIHGLGKVFSGGADIRQFNTPAAVARPMTRDINKLIQGMAKAVVASIHGVAYGAGLELALGCHYRLAEQSASLGLPEVQLGLVPGGGGTQRLTRLIGTRHALDMIQTGKPVAATRALELGLVDQLFTGDPAEAGCQFARGLKTRDQAHPLVALRPIPTAEGLDFEAIRQSVNLKARNALAQQTAISCVENATQHDLETGLDKERALFDALVAGPESKALRYLFFAEREVAKLAFDKANAAPFRLIGNRMLSACWREALMLEAEGARREQIDAAMIRFGFDTGPFALAASSGLDIPLLVQNSENTHRDIHDEEIVRRCVLALANEGACVLQEGIVERANQVDVICVNGYGFPAWRGGPIFYAQSQRWS